jgi:hypothetical protein
LEDMAALGSGLLRRAAVGDNTLAGIAPRG